jgi:CheY-like chemotaxis protein
MGRVSYDINKLAENKIMDTSTVSWFFYDNKEYFNKLTEFVKNHPHYLANYNPTVVVVSEDEKKVFIQDCANVRAILTQLGMTLALSELNNMENAVLAGEIKELDDGFTKLHATLEIYANIIEDAEIEALAVKPAVLLVTDNQDVQQSMTQALEKKYVIIPASSGEEVIELLENTLAFALIILSLDMSGINGYELGYLIHEHERFKNTQLFFLVDGIKSDPIRNALPHMKDRYIQLPVRDKKKLLALIENELKEK